MKRMFFIIFSVICICCTNYGKKVDPVSNSKAESIDSVLLGDLKIYLPYINGMNECSSKSSITKRAQQTISRDAIILGIYITNSDYEIIDLHEDLELNKYVIIYGTKSANSMNVSQSNFKRLTGKVPINIGGMNLLESYSIDKMANSHIFIIDFFDEQMINILNFLLINKTIINIVYVSKGSASAEETKSLNNQILYKFLHLNR